MIVVEDPLPPDDSQNARLSEGRGVGGAGEMIERVFTWWTKRHDHGRPWMVERTFGGRSSSLLWCKVLSSLTASAWTALASFGR